MKEALFILLVVAVLAALTAIRYRKQIAGVIGVARMLRGATKGIDRSRTMPRETEKTIPLVNCSACGVWVPRDKAIRVGNSLYCSDECRRASS
jgi:hypothetical protein